MALDATDVRVGVSGAVYVGSSTATLPTTAAGTIDSSLTDVGYISEDGVTETYEDETTEITAWQNGAVVRRLITSSQCSLAFTMIESKAKVLELFHKGSTVVSDGAGGHKINVLAPGTDRRRFVLDVVDGTDVIRVVVHNGEVTERGEIAYKSDEAVGYPVTVTCYPATVGGDDNVVLTKLSNAAGWSET